MIRHTVRLSIIVSLVASCIGQTLVAGEPESRARFALSVYGGLTFGSTNWYFVRDDEQYPVYPSLTIGGGVQFGPLVTLDGAQLDLSFEVAFGRITTTQQDITHQLPDAHPLGAAVLASMNIERTSSMIWTTVSAGSRLSPFIRAGLGASMTHFVETYSTGELYSTSLSRLSFTWGIGGGLRWQVTRTLEFAFFLDDWITTADMRVTLPSGNRNGIPAPYKMTGVGLRCLIHL